MDFKACNFVVNTKLKSNFGNLESLFNILSIHRVNFIVGKDKPVNVGKRSTVDYFGYEGVIVGLRFGSESRGITRTSKELKYVLGVDIQLIRKNINLKVSGDNIHVTGATSFEMAKYAVYTFLDYIEMCITNINKIKNNRMNKYVLKYLQSIDISKDRLLQLELPSVPEVSSFEIVNAFYTYKLGKKYSLCKIATTLSSVTKNDRKLYRADFHNMTSAKTLRISVFDFDKESTVTLYQSGTVKQFCALEEEQASEIAEELYDNITMLLA